MRVQNIHHRRIKGSQESVGALIDSLASRDDRLWPRDAWPAMRFEVGLKPGAIGGHGPVRYEIQRYAPGSEIRFEFRSPKGFDGTHGYSVVPDAEGCPVLSHSIDMEVHGSARLLWPFVFRPLHDALIEDSLDRAEHAVTGHVERQRSWSPYVRLLRRGFRALGFRRRRGRDVHVR
jgi:hypothetical protein